MEAFAHTHTAHVTRLHYLTLTFALRLTPALAHTHTTTVAG